MSSEPKLAADGERLLKEWNNASERIAHLRRALNEAECDAANTRNALGKWLTPDDAKEGESFNIWQGNGLLLVKLERGSACNGTFAVKWRQRPTKGAGT